MKLTDFCILFGLILMGIFVGNDLKIRLANEVQNSQIILNNNMDEIVVDGLRAGFVGIDKDDRKKIDLELVSNRVFEEMSLFLYQKNNMESMLQEYVKAFIYVGEEGYYVYEDGRWSEEIIFENGVEHSERVEIISNIILNKVGEVPLISYNEGESYKNTIGDNTLIIAYCGYNFMTNEFVYKNSYLSAATIELIED